MTGQQWYPPADNTSQNFTNVYPGDIMPHPNVFVLHSMECQAWPSYDGGAVAPTFSINCLGAKGKRIRQHFPANMSARALVNLPGGVQTNTLNVVQIEISGTCDPASKGRIAPFVPELSDDVLDDIAHLWLWLHEEWSVPLKALAPTRWKSYPSSYGASNGTRMTARAWNNFTGVCGHQHVPENEHGDPGNFPIARLLARVNELAGGSQPQPPQQRQTRYPILEPVRTGLGDTIRALDDATKAHPKWQFGKDMRAQLATYHEQIVNIEKPQ